MNIPGTLAHLFSRGEISGGSNMVYVGRRRNYVKIASILNSNSTEFQPLIPNHTDFIPNSNLKSLDLKCTEGKRVMYTYLTHVGYVLHFRTHLKVRGSSAGSA